MTDTKQASDTRAPAPPPRRVIVKFSDDVRLSYEAGAEKAIAALGIGPIEELRTGGRSLRIGPLFTGSSPRTITGLVDGARALSPKCRPPNFLSFFAADAPKGADLHAIAKQFSEWDSVDYAYVEWPAALPSGGSTPPAPPAPPANQNPLFANQDYLLAAPIGVGAYFAWMVRGGAGAGVRLVDVEQGWKIERDYPTTSGGIVHVDTHEDLPADRMQLVSGEPDRFALDHGTKTLGVIAAVDNARGCLGIAPEVEEIHLVSTRRTEVEVSSAADATLDAIATAAIGDILLLEMQTARGQDTLSLGPMEVEPAMFDLIRLATAAGLIVVEPAGNGGHDLDRVVAPNISVFRATIDDDDARRRAAEFLGGIGVDLQDELFRKSLRLNRSSLAFEDSGAIMVGSATSPVPHERLGTSGHGSRVDCYAWGRDVQTTTNSVEGMLDLYTEDGTVDPQQQHYGGTSSASAIIGGVAVCAQGLARAHLGRSLTPAEMRDILVTSVPAQFSAPWMTPTPSADPDTDRIGVMPNLFAVAIHLSRILRDEGGLG